MPRRQHERTRSPKPHAAVPAGGAAVVRNPLQAVVYGVVLATIIGWVLYIGRSVFVPIVFAVLLAYVIVGLARALERLPAVGARLPAWLRYTLSILAIAGLLAACVSLAVNNVGRLVQQAPVYQDLLLARIQRVAEFFGIEAAPTWTTLRDGLLEQGRLQDLIGPTVMSVTGFASAVVIVFVYVAFLLIEKRKFRAKLGLLSDDPQSVTRIRDVIDNINSRIGQYLAIKTLINVILGAVCWAVMAPFGLEFVAFWALVIAVLNYMPYIGSVLGVLLPMAWAIVQFDDLGTLLTLLLLLSVAQFVIGYFLDPFLMGNSLNLSPFVILASLTVWGSLWGIAGAFLAVPITSALVIVFSEFRGTRPIAVLMSHGGQLDGRRAARGRERARDAAAG